MWLSLCVMVGNEMTWLIVIFSVFLSRKKWRFKNKHDLTSYHCNYWIENEWSEQYLIYICFAWVGKKPETVVKQNKSKKMLQWCSFHVAYFLTIFFCIISYCSSFECISCVCVFFCDIFDWSMGDKGIWKEKKTFLFAFRIHAFIRLKCSFFSKSFYDKLYKMHIHIHLHYRLYRELFVSMSFLKSFFFLLKKFQGERWRSN